jgi:hypothetical protein
MSAWKAFAGRISLFPALSATTALPPALDLYQRGWGGSPESFQSSTNPLMPAVAQGRRGNLAVSCTVHQTRIDFNLSPPPPPNARRPDGRVSFSLIEDTRQFGSELERLVGFIGGGAVGASVLRVGLFVQLLRLTATVEEANRALVGIMPEQYRPKLKDEEELVFQVNRPRMSSQIQGVKMNRVERWSMERFQVLSISVGPAVPSVGATPQTQEFIAASMLFDINNAPTGSSFNPGQQSSLLVEGLGMVRENLREINLEVEGF